MNFTATVINGLIHLPPGVRLEEGAQVVILPRPFDQKGRAEHYAGLIGRVSSRSREPVQNPAPVRSGGESPRPAAGS